MKNYLVLICMLCLAYQSQAQNGENYLNAGIEAGVTINEYYQSQYPAGFGANLKGLYGVGLNGQFAVSAHYLYFPLDPSIILQSGDNLTMHLIPLLLGYRLNFDQFFLEPQLGGALLINRFKTSSDAYSESETEFAFAVEVGHAFDLVEISIRYQHAGPSPLHFGLMGIRAAYRIPLSNN